MRRWGWILGAGAALCGVALAWTTVGLPSGLAGPAQAAPKASSVYEFTLTRIDGRPLPLAQFRGQVMLLVNTASHCGFTPQYEGLQKLHDRYRARGFTVIGIPSGDFMGQEFDDNRKIAEFCETKFGITFPLTEKSHVRGAKAIPFYQWARTQLGPAAEPGWNFHKLLVGRDGRLIAGFGSRTEPESAELRAAIEKALG
ncbi:MAG: redoxin domain-containing protein [Sphingomonadaceae bacterium]|uniref:glutathione peroxidase n=1 Tax=Thermaurantiacus sp. TaxID=2820283 RepID=UPI00298EF618|nr:redoxin domain-containing protein [Thermaurantiacus sp.]MCS6986957.1 redoxin domain-containing protein [Sphingomonadaceae bacterium]MDW8415443.1 redoxin domain-containing protein [Thermaurantiacus sp.]